MEVYQFILAVCGLVVVTAFIIYKIREKSPRFRIVEENNLGIKSFSPQVRVNGVWFSIAVRPDKSNLCFITTDTIYMSFGGGHWFLDEHDALSMIDKFKSAGNYTIPSNEKLKSNQRQIIVE